MNYPPEKVKVELAAFERKPVSLEAKLHYPYTELDDRIFEVLLYSLYKADLDKGLPTFFDEVILRTGSGDKGRDVSLNKDGKPVGLIQCKRLGEALTKPAMVREVIKFLLHVSMNPHIAPNLEGFQVLIAAASGFNEACLDLFGSFSKAVIAEKNLESWISEVKDQYAAFDNIEIDDAISFCRENLTKVKVSGLQPVDLDGKLTTHSELISRFFKVRTVVETDKLEESLRKVLRESNLSQLTDDDIAAISKRIEAIPEEERTRLGSLSMFGYRRSIILNRFKTDETWQKLILSLTTLTIELDNKYIQAVQDHIATDIHAKISIRPDVPPIAKQAALPYIMGQLLQKQISSYSPQIFMKLFKESHVVYQKSSFEDIKAEILKTGKEYLNKDYAAFQNPPNLREIKMKIADFTYGSYASIEEMEEAYDKGLSEIRPLLEDIAEAACTLLNEIRTITIQDLRFLDNSEELAKIFAQFKD